MEAVAVDNLKLRHCVLEHMHTTRHAVLIPCLPFVLTPCWLTPPFHYA
jgi:hypothetical protein